MFEFTLPGMPIAQKRPRFASGVVFNSQKKEKILTRLHLNSLLVRSDFKILSGAITLDLTFFVRAPHNKKNLLGEFCVSKPDLDNYVKFYLDVMNGLVYNDDNQVCQLYARKIYSGEPKTVISVSELYAC